MLVLLSKFKSAFPRRVFSLTFCLLLLNGHLILEAKYFYRTKEKHIKFKGHVWGLYCPIIFFSNNCAKRKCKIITLQIVFSFSLPKIKIQKIISPLTTKKQLLIINFNYCILKII